MLLADSAQELGGKLYILGGGWSLTGPDPTPSAIAIKFDIPWDRANHRYNVRLQLMTADGEPVTVTREDGEEVALEVAAQVEAGRPAGLKPGSTLDAAIAINFGPLPLEADERYEWRLTIDGHHDEDWSLPFTTRPAR
jgi:hypothetical protein